MPAFLAWLVAFGVLVTLSLGLFAPGIGIGQQSAQPNPPPVQPPASPAQPPPAPNQPSPMDNAIAWMKESARVYAGVKDYTCTMVKQERVKGKLQDEHVIFMKFREQPFSVYMKWQSPKAMVGQEVAYVHGRNNNMMRVHANGVISGAIGFVSIAPNDPRALQHSSHVITESGIGNVINRCLNDWQRERTLNRMHVDIAEIPFNQRPCIRIVVTALQQGQGIYCFRTIIYLDKQTHLPARAECYDWPRQGGPAHGELLEVYSFLNMQTNVGLGEKDFNY
jgi:hypothetical protein